MNKTFSKKQIAQIAINVRRYKKLVVTTEGQMFMNEPDAEEAVRVKNMILDDANDHVGIITVTEDMVTDRKLKEFAKNPEKFGSLFNDARIPVAKKKVQHERKKETPVALDKKDVASVEAALGIGETSTEKTSDDAPKTGGLFGKK